MDTPPVFVSPRYPSHGTQAARLLAHLLHRSPADPLAAWFRLGIYRQSDVVFQLRNLGWPVVTGRKAVRNRFGEACHVADYHLPAESIEESGSEGQNYAAHEMRLMAERRAA